MTGKNSKLQQAGGRGNTYKRSAKDPAFVVVGIHQTEKYGEDHPLYQQRRIALPYESRARLRGFIRTFGFRGSIPVRKDGPNLLLIGGRQRYRAVCEINDEGNLWGTPQEILLCFHFEQVSDEQAFGLMQAENEKIPVDPIQRALDMRKGINDLAMSRKEVLELFAMKNTKTLDYHLACLDLDDALQEKVATGEIPIKAGAALSAFARKDQHTEYERLKAEGKLTAAGAEEAAREGRAAREGKDPATVKAAPPKRTQLHKFYERVQLPADDENHIAMPTGIAERGEEFTAGFLAGIGIATGDVNPAAKGFKGLKTAFGAVAPKPPPTK